MPELSAVLAASREKTYHERKFAAAMQGVDLDKETSTNAWEELKAKVASKGQATDSKDILSLQGTAAAQAGFGINMGLDYEDLTGGETT